MSETPEKVSGLYHYPIKGDVKITTDFYVVDRVHKKPHNGIDFAGKGGTAVLAARAGTIWISGAQADYGHWVIIKHDDNQYSIYGHLGPGSTPKGKTVNAGDQIGTIGEGIQGRSTGPHLHFEVRKGAPPTKGTVVDPRPLVGW
jgi:murein DD-endopeptidase MepM/ murein hydrolase activator NlpD